MTSPHHRSLDEESYHLVLAIALTTVFVPASGLAAQSEAELMRQAKITKSQAEKIVRAKVPNAKIQSEEIEHEHHALVWSFDLVKTGSRDVTEVLVNAKTGKIISVNTESPADQAKKSAADKATVQK